MLLDVAKANSNVMTNPAPFVYFERLRRRRAQFTLYAYAYDITKSLALRTDLRIAILEAFEKAGIDMLHRPADRNGSGAEPVQGAKSWPTLPKLNETRQSLADQGSEADAVEEPTRNASGAS